MAQSLAEMLEEMNARLAKARRHPCRGAVHASRYDGHSCHCVLPTLIEAYDESAESSLQAHAPAQEG